MTKEHSEEKTNIEYQTPNPEPEELDVDLQTSEMEQAESIEEKPDSDVTVESVTEAVLFASDEPLTAARLADIVGTGVKQIRQHIDALNLETWYLYAQQAHD